MKGRGYGFPRRCAPRNDRETGIFPLFFVIVRRPFGPTRQSVLSSPRHRLRQGMGLVIFESYLRRVGANLCVRPGMGCARKRVRASRVRTGDPSVTAIGRDRSLYAREPWARRGTGERAATQGRPYGVDERNSKSGGNGRGQSPAPTRLTEVSAGADVGIGPYGGDGIPCRGSEDGGGA